MKIWILVALMAVCASEVATPEAPADAPAAPSADKPKEDEKETPEELKKRARKPPAEGPCKMCEQMRQLNRLLLCYPCWLKDKLHKDSGGTWLPGDPHPASCGCDGPGGCSTKRRGN
ncbi:MAG: hypothetical protein KGZ65_04120 [Sphingomonadales bacterium]|nr:hypothetical protein [Sphingomonadaceae bacterium]MBS3930399.1 hypothetical protein [Sphingomonadales bacterium]